MSEIRAVDLIINWPILLWFGGITPKAFTGLSSRADTILSKRIGTVNEQFQCLKMENFGRVVLKTCAMGLYLCGETSGILVVSSRILYLLSVLF